MDAAVEILYDDIYLGAENNLNFSVRKMSRTVKVPLMKSRAVLRCFVNTILASLLNGSDGSVFMRIPNSNVRQIPTCITVNGFTVVVGSLSQDQCTFLDKLQSNSKKVI